MDVLESLCPLCWGRTCPWCPVSFSWKHRVMTIFVQTPLHSCLIFPPSFPLSVFCFLINSNRYWGERAGFTVHLMSSELSFKSEVPGPGRRSKTFPGLQVRWSRAGCGLLVSPAAQDQPPPSAFTCSCLTSPIGQAAWRCRERLYLWSIRYYIYTAPPQAQEKGPWVHPIHV